MATRLFRYLFENTSKAIIMNGCIWNKDTNEQFRYVYASELYMADQSERKVNTREKTQMPDVDKDPLDLYAMGSYCVEDIERLLYAVHHKSVNTVVLPYVSSLQRLVLMYELLARQKIVCGILDFLKDPYLYLKSSNVKKIYFVYGNGKDLTSIDQLKADGYYFQQQDSKVLKLIAEIEDREIPVVKAGYINVNQMLFYFGHFGTDIRKVKEFMSNYDKNNYGIYGKIVEDCQQCFGRLPRETLTMFCCPIDISCEMTDSVFTSLIYDSDQECHSDLISDEGDCSVKCMYHHDFESFRYHKKKEHRNLCMGLLLLGNLSLSKYLLPLFRRYQGFQTQIRGITIPTADKEEDRNHYFMLNDQKDKNILYWIMPMNTSIASEHLERILHRSPRNRIICINQDYGCCFNGYLTTEQI